MTKLPSSRPGTRGVLGLVALGLAAVLALGGLIVLGFYVVLLHGLSQWGSNK